jgi:hypothetical protein
VETTAYSTTPARNYRTPKITVPFLLEMQAAVWGIDLFSTYLRGRPFTLFNNHKPLVKLGKVLTKTLIHLQEAMQIL